MKFLKHVEAMLTSKYFAVLPICIALLAALYTPHRLTDQSHEIVQAGTKWIDGSILYVQSWSSHSPQTLYFGYLYGRYMHNGFTRFMCELLLITILGALLAGMASHLYKKSIAARNAVLLLCAALLCVPRVWQYGISDQKLSVIFLAVFAYTYLLWKKSSTTQWLFGSTSKNWRYILLSGIALSLLIYTSWSYALLAVPILIDFCTYKKWKLSELTSWAAFLVVPFLLESWVWLSHLSSHRLLTLYAKSIVIGMKSSTHIAGSLSLVLPSLLFVAVCSFALLSYVQGIRYRTHRSLWMWSIVSIALAALWPAWVVTNVLVLAPIFVWLRAGAEQKSVRPGLIAGVAAVIVALSLPLRLLNSRQARLESAQADIAIAYVEQRLMESNTVTYYGKGAGLYDASGFENPTRYADVSVLAYGSDGDELESTFRGDAEALTPPFALIATSDELRAPTTPRLDQYFDKHYDKVADLDGYQVLKRK